jgi:protein-S-isoprenylcysteine O-methyltransferase Ste14
MTTDRAADLALVLFAVGVSTTFVLRTWVHRRRTGTSGFGGISGHRGSAGWWGGVLFVVALGLAAGGFAMASLAAVPPAAAVPSGLRWAGLVLGVVGFGLTMAAQSGMGASWRIGVDETERTDLVTTGLFGLVRNPIFTAMCAALTGLTLMATTGLTVAALVCLVVAVQLQVRVVEEPYLEGAHGSAYASYTARVGRFLPGVGRSRAAARDEVQ